jgi:Heterokaryon incompatibility protein (HET)
MAPLSYERLDAGNSEIRLLKFRQGDDGEICCSLTKHYLASAPEYLALSYVWGDPHVTKNITVDGMTFAATTNLVAALEILPGGSGKEGAEDYNYWIDAICINQEDIHERSDQVHMMGDIFKNATVVVAWIGPEMEGSTEAIQVMKYLVEEIESSPEGDTSFLLKPPPRFLVNKSDLNPQDDDFTTQNTVSSDNLGSVAIARIKYIRNLFNKRSFWKRAWILHELVLAQKVLFLCGTEGFRYNDIMVLFGWLNSIPDTTYHSTVSDSDWNNFKSYFDLALDVPLRALVLAEQLRRKDLPNEEPYLRFWRTLMYARRMIASDPRDKIYSLLSLVQISVNADYSKTVQALYLEVARILFPQVAMDEWFDRATPSRKRIPALPSWVVDWDSRSKEYDWGVSLDGDLYNAAGTMNSLGRQAEINGLSLLVQGAIFDETFLLATTCSDGILVNAAKTFQFDITGGQPHGDIEHGLVPPGYPRGQASLRLSLSDKMPGSGQRFAISSTYLTLALDLVKVVTVCAAVETATGRLEIPRIHEEDRSHFIKLFFDEDAANKTLDSDFSEAMEKEDKFPEPPPFSQHRRTTLFSKHFRHARHFYTRKRYLGYGPAWIQEGDLVCVLENCRVPVLLRKVDGYYVFISTCFVLGLMDGEAAEMVNRGEISMQTFEIH